MGYSRFDRPIQSGQRFMTMGGAPVTMTIIVICILCFVADHMLSGIVLAYLAGAFVPGRLGFPWRLITYPFIDTTFMSLVFSTLWLFGIGGSLERAWGRGRYILFMILIITLPSIGVYLASKFFHNDPVSAYLDPFHPRYLMFGLWVPLAALTVAWAAIDPFQEIMFYFVLKVQARWVALIGVGWVYFDVFRYEPILGIFGLLGCVLAYYWVRGRVPYSIRSAFDGLGSSKRRSRGSDLRFTDVDRVKGRGNDLEGKSKGGLLGTYRSYQQRKKLEKLWKASGLGDDDNPIGRRR